MKSDEVLGVKRLAWILQVVFAMVATCAVCARAQSDAALWGTVKDSSGALIPGATVRITSKETGVERTILTDDAGRFEAPSLPVGHYTITASKVGFRTSENTEISLVVGQRLELSLILEVGDVRQSIEVPANMGLVMVSTDDVSGLVSERQIKELPLNGRSYDELLTLNPGVVNYTSQRAGSVGTSNSAVGNMFAAAGRRPQENVFLLNGIEFSSASEINSTPGGVSGQLLGVDAVREFSVVTDTYGAEYGKRPGAQVDIVTASGTNELHGTLYDFVRNSGMDARNYFDHGDIPEFERNNFGGALGGPLRKDKTFLFGNYEGLRQDLGLSNLSLVPDNASRAAAAASVQPLLALWPLANGPELLSAGQPSGIAEAFTNPRQSIREDFGTTRFDQTFSDKDSFTAVYTIDDSYANSPSSNPLTIADIALREQVASLSETHIFSPSFVNKATFGFSRGAFFFNTATTVSLPGWIHAGQPVGAIVVGGGTTLNGASQIANGGTNAGSNLTAVRNLFTVNDQLTVTRGIHLFQFGVWFQPVQANDDLLQDQYGQASFTNLQSFLKGTVSTYTYAPFSTPLDWRSLEGAFFGQDTIHVNSSFELRIGFRGEFTSGWTETNDRASNFVFTQNGLPVTHPVIGISVLNTQPAIGGSALARNNAKFLPAPRVGIAWSPLGSKKTVVRAGFGLYYALIDNLSYRLDQNAPFNPVYAVKSIAFSSIAPGSTYSGARLVPSGVQPDVRTPAVESWSFKIEQAISQTTSFSVGYAGSHGYHELLSLDANLPTATICPASPCPAGYPEGAVYYPAGAALANPNLWNSTHWFSEGISSYNALQVDMTHHFSRGLEFRGAYTYSKALDDGDNLNTSVATNSPAFVANPLDPRSDYGRASFDIRQAATINATYSLPFGRDNDAFAGYLVRDWQISGIQTLESGLPFTPQLSYNPSNDGDTRNPVRPSLNPSFTGRLILGGPNEYFDPSAFIQPLSGTYGNAGRNILPGPTLYETDLALARRFSLSERFNLQFRAEAFNIFNQTNFNTPNPVVFTGATEGPSPTAGLITSTATTSRQIQLGLKLLW